MTRNNAVRRPTYDGSCLVCGSYRSPVGTVVSTPEEKSAQGVCTDCFRDIIHTDESVCSVCGDRPPEDGYYLSPGRGANKPETCRECAEKPLEGVPSLRKEEEVEFNPGFERDAPERRDKSLKDYQ